MDNTSGEDVDVKINKILLGVATELILKSIYIKKDYLIYKTKTPIKLNKFKDSWDYKKTLDFYELVENCGVLFNKNIKPENLEKIKKVLHQIRLWRNDEAHSYSKKQDLKGDDYSKVIETIVNIAKKAK